MSVAAERRVERALARKREKYAGDVERILAAARAVMAARDTFDPTVADILAEARLSTAAFYRHFPTKDDLLLALVEEAGATTRSYLAHRLERAEGPVEQVGTWIAGMCGLLRTAKLVETNRAFLLNHPRLVERFAPELDALIDLLAAPLAQAISEARAAAGQPVGDAALDARLIHYQVFAVLIDHAAARRPVPPTLVDALQRHAVRAVLGGTADQARPPRPTPTA
jgi:AcrR family transcriptional regulator